MEGGEPDADPILKRWAAVVAIRQRLLSNARGVPLRLTTESALGQSFV